MRFALRTNYGEGAIWLLQDKTVKFPFIKQFNTKGAPVMICTPKVRHIWRCISVTVVPFPIFPSRKALFYAALLTQPSENVLTLF